MSNYRRVRVAGATYFFTVNVLDRKRIDLTRPEFRQALRDGIKRTRQTLPFKMDACVLLPDHIHCIWTLPPNDANFSARGAIIKRNVSRCCGEAYKGYLSISRQKRRESGFWQKRFWEHWIHEQMNFEKHVDYIYYNPAKHGHIQQVIYQPYSTFHRDVKDGIYHPHWGSMIENRFFFGEIQNA
jgi:putative transposase